MPSSVTCDLMLYADDSALMVSGKNVSDIEFKLEQELCNLSKWLESNKLSLHLGKSESILFASKTKLRNVNKMKIVCNGNEIVAKEYVKYLGATLEQDVSGNIMGSTAIKKVNKGLKFMYRNASMFDVRCRKLLCQSLLQSHFDYACNVWFRSMDKCFKMKLQCAQNKMIRYVLSYGPRHHLVHSDFIRLKCLNVPSRVDYLTLNLMYKIFHKSAPKYMYNVEITSHRHNTRNSSMSFMVPHVKTQGSMSFKFNGVKLWNELPDNIKMVEDKGAFKSKCKHFLMSKMYKEETSEFTM